MSQAVVEKFAPNGGRFSAALGLLVVVLLIGGWAIDPSEVPLWVPATGLFLAALIWSAMLRPRLLVTPGTLVLRNMLETVRVPLAAVSEIAVRQVTAVRVGEKRYVCPGAGRSLRQAMKGSPTARMRSQMSGLPGADTVAAVEPGMIYGDYIENRVRQLVSEDRDARGVRPYSAEVDALGAEVRREPAWPEIVALAVSALLLVLAIVLG